MFVFMIILVALVIGLTVLVFRQRNSYTYMFVSTVNTVYGKYGKNIVLDMDDSSKRIIMLDEAESAVKINSIREGDVLSVRESIDHTLIKVNIVSEDLP